MQLLRKGWERSREKVRHGGQVGNMGSSLCEGTVILHSQVVDTMDGDCAAVSVTDHIVPHIGVAHGADHVEVNAVSAKPAELPHASHLNVFDACGERLALRAVDNRRLAPRVQHDMTPVPV